MSVKRAKDSFSREEILDILSRNAALYKEEEGFAEFFAQLSLYLASCEGEGERSPSVSKSVPPVRGAQDWEEPMVPEGQTPQPARASDDEDEDGPVVMPPTVAELRQSRDSVASDVAPRPFKPTRTPPPPPPPPDESDEDWESPSGRYNMPSSEQPKPESNTPKPFRSGGVSKNVEVDRVSLTPYAESSGSVKKPEPQEMHPQPEEPKGPPAKKPEEDTNAGFVQRKIGKARVYRVSRSYKSSTSAEVPCGVCGTMIPLGVKHCPGCGTPV